MQHTELPTTQSVRHYWVNRVKPFRYWRPRGKFIGSAKASNRISRDCSPTCTPSAVELWGELRDWCAWREGRETALLETDTDKWSVESERTARWRDALRSIGQWRYPRDLSRLAITIWAETRSNGQALSLRDAWRQVSHAGRSYRRCCEHGSAYASVILACVDCGEGGAA